MARTRRQEIAPPGIEESGLLLRRGREAKLLFTTDLRMGKFYASRALAPRNACSLDV